MSRILIIGPRAPFPYPPRLNGGNLRFNPVLEYLGARHEVDLMQLGPLEAVPDDLPAAAICREVECIDLPAQGEGSDRARLLKAMVSRPRAPWEFVRAHRDHLWHSVSKRLASTTYDSVLFCAQVDLATRLVLTPGQRPRCVIDWVDAPSLHLERRVPRPTGWRGRLRERRVDVLKGWQRKVNARAEASVYITEADRAHANPQADSSVHVVPNGLFDWSECERSPGPQDALTLGFLGNMAYEPNIRGALRLHGLFERMKRERPGLRLKIIGRDPDPRIAALAGPDVEVTGFVDSVWPHLATTDIAVFPLDTGAGLQNKVLEALAASCPVVTTPTVAAGLAVGADGVLSVGRTDDELAAKTETLLRDVNLREETGKAGLNLVREHFDWTNILPRYERILLGA